MIARFKFLLIILFSIFYIPLSFASVASPAGFWETPDADDGKPRSIIQISENNGKLSGIVIKQFLREGESANPICAKCKGAFKDKPIMGLTVLWGVKKTQDAWKNGNILAPKKGEIYHCDITIFKNDTLNVTIYKNNFMRKTQTWNRVADPKTNS